MCLCPESHSFSTQQNLLFVTSLRSQFNAQDKSGQINNSSSRCHICIWHWKKQHSPGSLVGTCFFLAKSLSFGFRGFIWLDFKLVGCWTFRVKIDGLVKAKINSIYSIFKSCEDIPFSEFKLSNWMSVQRNIVEWKTNVNPTSLSNLQTREWNVEKSLGNWIFFCKPFVRWCFCLCLLQPSENPANFPQAILASICGYSPVSQFGVQCGFWKKWRWLSQP